MRLLRALRGVRPSSTRELLSLAAEQMHRELLDLARHYYGPLGEGANHASTAGRGDSSVARAVRRRRRLRRTRRSWRSGARSIARSNDCRLSNARWWG